ncbi:Major Facilitator Superfamily protein [Clostridium cavendishii DSM 21758]|uniref:Major Facilitator Superfamily protein n=1 Tax=Clostridium cavendishii DSM 21758 TaxID=1121302 RepID=A0A1M6GEH6_9CLOT|nr:MFS transporter [Clostridium cavendishii]SHJ08360.1 Major Facilitator Superfamily protein [Clostridium cavendishii DSM 21758]
MKNIKKIYEFKNFLLLWLGQSLSQMGSGMTSFALILWAYQKQGTAMSVALLSVFSYLPYVLVSIFAGALIDKFNKKRILLICNSVAAICLLCVFYLMSFGMLKVWYLYIINFILGSADAFEVPVTKATITLMVKEEYYTTVSGLRSLSNSIISVFSPVLATTLVVAVGFKVIFTIDFISFVIAFLNLLMLVKIPREYNEEKNEETNILNESLQGFIYLKKNKGFLYLIIYMAVINFISSVTFLNILPAMILARTSNNEKILSLVSGAIGIGGIVGGLLVTIFKLSKNKVKIIAISSALSFVLWDVLLGVGKIPFVWIFSAFVGNLPIPFLNAAENYLLMSKIPKSIQGRIFSIRGALQFSTVPIGYLVGGLLADKIFEPLMLNSEEARNIFGYFVGVGKGSGMALMFIITGILGFILSFMLYNNKYIRNLENDETSCNFER